MELIELETLSDTEITSTLNRASLFGGKLVYPTMSISKSFDIQNLEVSGNNLVIKLFQDLSMDEKWPVTVELNYRNMFFQMDPDHYELEGNLILADVPKRVRAIPERYSDRYVLPLTSQITSTIYRTEKRGGSCELKAQILDVSREGLGLIIPTPESLDVLKENDHLWIKALDTFELEEPIFAKVVYVYQRKFKDTFDLKAGVSLHKPIPDKLFRHLQEISRLVMKG